MTIAAVIPTYNHAHYVVRAVRSALEQTRGPDEIIVVDDGSTDNTRAALAEFGSRIRYVFQPNAGLAAARNTGMRSASSAWVALLDADDFWYPDKLRLGEMALQGNSQAVLLYTAVVALYPEGERVCSVLPAGRLWPGLRCANALNASTVILRRQAALDEGGFDESLRACEDWDLWVRLAVKYPFLHQEQALTGWQVSATSMSRNIDAMIQNAERILEKSLLLGLEGWTRAAWRRRIRAALYYRAAFDAREFGDPRATGFVLRSLAQWPLPTFRPQRYATLALQFLKR